MKALALLAAASFLSISSAALAEPAGTAAAPADQWDNDGPALVSAKIKTCLTLHSSKCGQESYFECATEHGTQSEIDQGYCVHIAYEVWLRLIDHELGRPGRGQAWADEAKEAQAAWLVWSDYACRMRTPEGGASHSRRLVACKIDSAELWLRQLRNSGTTARGE